MIGFTTVLLAVNPADAQNRISIQGKVSDQETNNPVDAVSVSWKNKGIGSISNSEGQFVLYLPASYTAVDSLTFSCVGYQTQNVAIQSIVTDKNLMVGLRQSASNLKEVVVKPLGLKELLDSISRHNLSAFIPQMKLKGYYRELVYTNNKCTAYADALCAYYYNRVAVPEGQLNITASRCLKETKKNEDKNNMEIYKESKLDPNLSFGYALLSAMFDKYLPLKSLPNYDYILEGMPNQSLGDLKITIYPKANAVNEFYKITLFLTANFTLTSYHLEIPEKLLPQVKEKSLLGIHFKITGTSIDVKYTMLTDGNYPSYYAVSKSARTWGKFMGTTMDQSVTNKSEFVVSDVDRSKELKPFSKQETYKKGNICSNGLSMNDEMLKNNTIIIPSSAEATAIKTFIN